MVLVCCLRTLSGGFSFPNFLVAIHIVRCSCVLRGYPDSNMVYGYPNSIGKIFCWLLATARQLPNQRGGLRVNQFYSAILLIVARSALGPAWEPQKHCKSIAFLHMPPDVVFFSVDDTFVSSACHRFVILARDLENNG